MDLGQGTLRAFEVVGPVMTAIGINCSIDFGSHEHAAASSQLGADRVGRISAPFDDGSAVADAGLLLTGTVAQRLGLEQVTTDLKHDAGMIHMLSGTFQANAAWAVACRLAHNLVRWTQLLTAADGDDVLRTLPTEMTDSGSHGPAETTSRCT